MRALLITGCDTAIRKDIHKSRKMDCLNERCADSIRALSERFSKVWERESAGERGQTMSR